VYSENGIGRLGLDSFGIFAARYQQDTVFGFQELLGIDIRSGWLSKSRAADREKLDHYRISPRIIRANILIGEIRAAVVNEARTSIDTIAYQVTAVFT
jgi:hypothetical protein